MRHYIIDFVNTVTEEDINNYLSECGATILKTFSAFDKVVLVECLTVPPVTDIVESVIDDMDQSNHIKLLTTVPIEFPTLPTEGAKTVVIADQKDWWKVYSGSVVDLDDESFQLPLSGNGATVYLMDSGIKADHPDFVDADIDLLYSLNDDFIDRKGHGTALASVIVGKTCGITNAKLKVVKIFDKDTPTKLSDFLGALDSIYADFTAVNTYGVINCSWEIARNEYVEAKLRTLWLSGVQIVVAAGNTSTEIGNVTPAAMPEALVVGAYNASLLPCDFSDYSGAQSISVTGGTVNGGQLSGWAPGENIYVATLDGGFNYISGTSISAAIHSAIIAYNATLPAFKFDDTLDSLFNTSTVNRMTFFLKNDLLLLDDPKYQNSPNKVSYLITDIVDPYYNVGIEPVTFVPFRVGVLSRSIIFNPSVISSVTINSPLPAGVTINNYGVMSGYTESIVNEDRDMYTVSLTMHYFDGTIKDTEIKVAFTNKDKDTAPVDPSALIPYILNASCRNVCAQVGVCTFGSCVGTSVCQCVTPKQTNCGCA